MLLLTILMQSSVLIFFTGEVISITSKSKFILGTAFCFNLLTLELFSGKKALKIIQIFNTN